jgi:hypothetical protein
MKKLLAVLIAGLFTVAGTAIAAEKKAEAKKPTAEECKKNPKLAGCEAAKPAEAPKK